MKRLNSIHYSYTPNTNQALQMPEVGLWSNNIAVDSRNYTITFKHNDNGLNRER